MGDGVSGGEGVCGGDRVGDFDKSKEVPMKINVVELKRMCVGRKLRVSRIKQRLVDCLLGLNDQPRKRFCHEFGHGIPPVSPNIYQIEYQPRTDAEDE